MDNTELSHHGIIGMKWGRRRYQNKDGSLTPAGKKRYGDDDDKKSESGKKGAGSNKKTPEETAEEKRARLLKSTDPNELYKNRSLLTTAEINERLTRIDTERRLGEVASKTKTTAMQKVDNVLKWGRKMNEVYEFTNTPMMKAFKKKLGIEKPEEKLTAEKALKNLDSITDEQLAQVVKRSRLEKSLKDIVGTVSEAAGKAKEQAKADTEDIPTYTPKKSDIITPKQKPSPETKKTVHDIVDSYDSDPAPGEYRNGVVYGKAVVSGLLPAPKDDD